ncbi:glycine zipper 2TM domain-containing protein [Pontixanthobacter sp.]|uniref:glycine zipper 2TM domain-containing protein n=1 Tax=Pontixanthobacter sp. TaxID=2792078 RepID=UPI003C7DA567
MTTRANVSIRQCVSLSAAASVIAVASPALAQPEMTYEERAYEYARPAASTAETEDVIYREQPVVQPVPAARYESEAGADYAVRNDTRSPAPQYVKTRYVKTHAAPQQVVYTQRQAQPVVYPASHQTQRVQHHAVQPQIVHYPQQGNLVQQPSFDREAWLAECRDRVGGGQRRDSNGDVIGGLVGAAAGGLIGNRIAGRGDRLGGTLIGAGVGGLAGLAVGNAIDRGNRADRDETAQYCEEYLAYYSNGYAQNRGYYSQQQMMLVPVMIQVPQQAVTREIVTYETVEEHVTTYENVPAQRRVAPRPTKRIQVAPQPAKRVRYIKGN